MLVVLTRGYEQEIFILFILICKHVWLAFHLYHMPQSFINGQFYD